MISLRQLIDDAAFHLDLHGSEADTSACYERLCSTFEGTHLTLTGQKLEMITELHFNKMLYVVTSYQDEKRLYVIPASVIDDQDPADAAWEWSMDVQIASQKKQIELTERHAKASRARLERMVVERHPDRMVD